MNKVIQTSKKYERLANKVISSVDALHFIKDCGIKIAYLTSTEEKKSNKKIVYADCRKVDEIYSPWCKYDFIITFYTTNCVMLDNNQLKILAYHELLHVGIDEKTTDVKYVTVPHDIEDFTDIVDKFGLHWNEYGADTPKFEDIVAYERE